MESADQLESGAGVASDAACLVSWFRGDRYLGACGKKVSGTFCEELALRVLCTKGTGHLFPAHCLAVRVDLSDSGYAADEKVEGLCFQQAMDDVHDG